MLLYRESLQVPLFLKLPGSRRAGETVAAPAALSRTSSRLSRRAQASRTSRGPKGTRSLLDPPGGPARRILSETFFPRIHFGWSDLASLYDGRWHYIDAPRAGDLRRRRGPGRTVEPLRAEARRAPRDARRDGEEEAGVRVGRRPRPRGAEEARVARLPERGAVERERGLARRPEGPDPHVRGAADGPRRVHRRGTPRRRTRSSRSSSPRIRGCWTCGTWNPRPSSSSGSPRRRSSHSRRPWTSPPRPRARRTSGRSRTCACSSESGTRR